jgi:glycosyltransferase involved in cell wall biosynthesis
MGELYGADKYYLLRHAALMVHMARFEAYPNAILDGASQGLVCVISDHASLKNLLGEGIRGYAIAAYDEKAVAEKITAILENRNSKELVAMREANIEFARRQSWGSVAKRVEEFYKKLEDGP